MGQNLDRAVVVAATAAQRGAVRLAPPRLRVAAVARPLQTVPTPLPKQVAAGFGLTDPAILEAAVEASPDGILVISDPGTIAYCNQRFATMWSLPADLVERRDNRALLTHIVQAALDPTALRLELQGEGQKRPREQFVEIEMRDGRNLELRTTAVTAESGIPNGRVLAFRDVTRAQSEVQKLRDLADRDALTGLLNRRRFDEAMLSELERAERLSRPLAVAVMDLDAIKVVNDSLGHHAGDALIISVGAVLQEQIRKTDILARIGGDEFAVLLPGADLVEAERIINGLVLLIRGHRTIFEGKPIRTTLSAGVAAVPTAGLYGSSNLLARADSALYESKEAGRDRVGVDRPVAGYRPRMDAHRTWSDRIREALEQDRFILYAQPIIDLATGKVASQELLIRMLGPNGEVLGPRAFLPAAERSGLIGEIDAWVVRRAVNELAAQQRLGNFVRVAINISGRTIGDPHVLSVLDTELRRSGADARGLVIEITETAAVASIDAAREYTEEIASMGCKIALDDFGAGFGSFYYVKHLPLDYLKIDGDFVEYFGRNPTDQAVVQAIVGLSESLRKNTIAEYVSDQRTVEALREFGVDYAQGFHIGTPQPLDRAWTAPPVRQRYSRLRI